LRDLEIPVFTVPEISADQKRVDYVREVRISVSERISKIIYSKYKFIKAKFLQPILYFLKGVRPALFFNAFLDYHLTQILSPAENFAELFYLRRQNVLLKNKILAVT